MINYLPYQPIIFESLFSAGPKIGTDRGESLPVDALDLTKFQFKSTFEGPNVIFDPTFEGDNTSSITPAYWVGASWDVTGGNAEYLGGGGSLDAEDVFLQGKLYKVTINVAGITSGSLLINANGEETQGEVMFNGETTVYVNVAENPNHSDGRLEIVPDDLNTGVIINSVSAIKAPDNYYVGIYDTDNNFQSEVTDLVYAKDSVTVTTEWNDHGLSDGCYKFGVVDEFNSIQNDDPSVNGLGSDYNLLEDTQLAEGRLYIEDTNTSWTDAYQITGLTDNTTYIISFNAKLLGGFPEIRLKSGTNTSTNLVSGSYEIEITTDGTTLEVQIQGGTSSISVIAIVSHFVVQKKGSVSGTVDKYSNKLDYKDWSSETLRMNWCNNDDAFDFVYENSGFTHVLRVDAKLVRPSYPSESERFRKSDGVTNILYFEPKKIYDLVISPVPEFVHDALSLAQGHDSFYIEDEGFRITEQDYEPEWEDATDYEASVVMEVETEPALTPKVRCSSSPNKDCSFPPSFLMLANEEDFVLLSTGDKILLADQF